MSDRIYIIKSIILFAIAIVFRAILGFIFLGGIDLRFYSYLSQATIYNSLPITCPYLNYFPLEAFFWWFSGWLHVYSILPFAFCFKVIPIFFDALLAVLIYTMVYKRRNSQAFMCGLLYALSPISMIIDCIHGQWEPLFLFFLLLSLYVRDFYADSVKKYIFVGVLFATSFLMRTVSLAFLPFIFVPHDQLITLTKKYKKRLFIMGAWFLGLFGLCAIVGLFFFRSAQNLCKTLCLSFLSIVFSPVFIACGGLLILMCLGGAWLLFAYKRWRGVLGIIAFNNYVRYQLVLAGSIVAFTCGSLFFFIWVMKIDLLFLINTILRCLNKGTQVIGLPLAWPFVEYNWLKKLVMNRVWVMLIIGWLGLRYFHKKISTIGAMVIIFIFMMGFLGLSTSYLMWPIAFLLIEERYYFLAWYNLVVSWLLLLFYANPFSDPRQGCEYVNILGFAVLKGFHWLVPPTFLLEKNTTFLVALLGKYVIPLSCVVFLFYLIHERRNKSQLVVDENQVLAVFKFFKNGFLRVCSIVVLAIGLLMLTTNWTDLSMQFSATKNVKMLAYDISCGAGKLMQPIYGDFCWFNIVFILFFGAVVWSVVALGYGYTAKKRVK